MLTDIPIQNPLGRHSALILYRFMFFSSLLSHFVATDLLAALNISRQRSGVSRLQSPNGVTYKIRHRAAYLILPQEYSSFLHSNFQGSIGVHLVGRQASGTSATLFSLSSATSPILQIISSTINNSLHLDYQSAAVSLGRFYFPQRNPIRGGEWVQLAVSLEPDRLVFYADCQEPVIIGIKSENRIRLDIPHDVVIALGSTPGKTESKFIVSFIHIQQRPFQ